MKRSALALLLAAGAALGIGGAMVLHRALGPPAPGPAGSTPVPAESSETGTGPAEPDSGAPDSDASIADIADAGDSGAAEAEEPEPTTLAEQREHLYARMLSEGGVTPEEIAKVRAIFDASPVLGQGNPDVSIHPMTRAECRKIRAGAQIAPDDPALCKAKFMVPVFDPAAGQSRDTAKLCVDQYEFPGLPCDYPVVNVRASEAAALCRAVGKRLCDAHEWEGACAGAVRSPDVEYFFNHDRRYSSGMHNLKRELVWAYGPKKDHGLCATKSTKTKDCPGGGWKQCGSNTYPAGAFPACKSPFGVYDQHGNAAEHMNLPLKPEEMMSAGPGGGVTEMKGSWFIFSKGEPHLDDCRWREPSWHESKVSDPNSHRNYHLGFRCCKDVGGP